MASSLKMVFTALVGMLVISCSSITSQQYFDRGEYIKSTKAISEEIVKVKKNEDRQVLVNRLTSIVSITENNYNNANSNYAIAESGFELFRLINTVENSNNLNEITDIQKRYNGIEILEKTISNAKKYSEEANSPEYAAKLRNKMSKENLLVGRYIGQYQEFSKYVADKFIDLGKYYEDGKNLKLAIEAYKKGYVAYVEFDKSYKNVGVKIYQLQKILDLEAAERSINSALEDYLSGNLNRALYKYKEVVAIFSKYEMYDRARIYKAEAEKIELTINLEDGKKHYNYAIYYYKRAEYKNAKREFMLAYRVYEKYMQNDMLDLIKGYLEVINEKINNQNKIDGIPYSKPIK